MPTRMPGRLCSTGFSDDFLATSGLWVALSLWVALGVGPGPGVYGV